MAASAPYFPFYVDDWLESDEIFEMGLECEGAYCRLLACMWKRGGSVPDKSNWICNALRIKPAKWKKIRAVLVDEMNVIQSENERLSNQRLTQELNIFEEKSQKSSSSAKVRWSKEVKTRGKKPNKNNTSVHANALRTVCHTDTDTDRDTDRDRDRDKNIKDFADSTESAWLESFEKFWECFGLKKGKTQAIAAWKKIPKSERDLPTILSAARFESKHRPHDDKSPKWAQGWISERRWLDEDSHEPDLNFPMTDSERSGVVRAYNISMPENPTARIELLEGLKVSKQPFFDRLQEIWESQPDHREPEFWDAYFHIASKSENWTGRSERVFFADLPFLLREETFAKVVGMMG